MAPLGTPRHLHVDTNPETTAPPSPGSSCFLACILSVPMETSPTPRVGSKALFSPAPAHPIQRASWGGSGRQGFPAPGGQADGRPCPAPTPQHYSKDKGAICTKLVKPKRKQGTKSAEEELAKGRGLRPRARRMSMFLCLAL